MKRNFIIKQGLLLLATVALLCACETQSSDEVAVSAIYQDYMYYYDQDTDKTHALAEFRDGGSLGNDVILYAPSAISMNGETMPYSAIPYDLFYHHYGLKHDGRINSGSYVFTDKNSKTYTNTADLTGTDIDLPANLTTISKSTDLTINWVGNPIGTGETIGLTFTITQDTSVTSHYFSSDVEGATSIMVTAAELSVLINGTQDVEITRIKDASLSAATAKGGNISTGYFSSKDCQIED